MEREEAVAFLRELLNYGGNPDMVNLLKTESGSYELHYKPAVLNQIQIAEYAEKHGFKTKNGVEGIVIIF